jgi:hypothetical protein
VITYVCNHHGRGDFFVLLITRTRPRLAELSPKSLSFALWSTYRRFQELSLYGAGVFALPGTVNTLLC